MNARRMALIYAPDDGWYWQRSDWKTSQLFASMAEAIKAYHDDSLVLGPMILDNCPVEWCGLEVDASNCLG